MKVETAISCRLDQLTFFTSPSAAIMKSATDGLLITQNTKPAKTTNTTAGIMVCSHRLFVRTPSLS